MEFRDLIAAKDAAIAADDEAASAEVAAEQAYEQATAAHEETSAERAAAHQAIHDLLVERGEHYLIDEDGTLTVYKAIDEPPGYVAVHPIPGALAGVTASKRA